MLRQASKPSMRWLASQASRAMVVEMNLPETLSSAVCLTRRELSTLQKTTTMTNASPTPTQGSAAPLVKPSLRQLRPQVNGNPVAFHVKDLLRGHSSQPKTAAPQPHSQPGTLDNSKRYDSDLVVVLDMDECMIHSQFLSSPGAAQVYAYQLQRHKQQQRQQSTNAHNTVVDHFRVSLPDGDLVHVNVRPGLLDFLDRVCERFETHIFTAAMSVYAKPVLDRLDPDGTKFAARWYREHCSYNAQQKAYVKDLDALPPVLMDREGRLKRTVLVDNNPLSFLTHPSNGILVSSFYNDPSDTSLEAVWKLLQELEPHEDVRPVLDQRFGLRQALERQFEPKSAAKGAAVA